MGVAIRHLSQLLNTVDAKTRILITLSDGLPEDYGEYRGKYGIEDTRMALVEARSSGIHPFCIAIDFETLGEETEDGQDLTDTVTVRHRDSMEQERIAISELLPWLLSRIV